jgi:purine-nucleoside phosphorylase
MSDAYDYPLRVQLRRSAEDLQLTGIREGVYVCQTGPCFETVAECRMMKMMGGDTAGLDAVEILYL